MMKKLQLTSTIILLSASVLSGCGGASGADSAAPEEPSAAVTASEQEGEPVSETETAVTRALEDTTTDADPAADDAAGKTSGGIDAADVYSAFSKIVSDSDPKQWDGFALIDLDGDGVDELFATCIEGEREDESMQPYMIVGHDNNGTVINDELQDGVAGVGGYRGMLYYLEGKGLLHESMTYAPYGVPADSVYVLKDGRIEICDQGDFSVESASDTDDGSWDPMEHGTYTWNGETVTEEEYYGKLNEATQNTEGLPLSEIDWKTKEEILKDLESR